MTEDPLTFSCVVIGEQSLVVQCCQSILSRGHTIRAVVSEDARIREWCRNAGVTCLDDVAALPGVPTFAFLFSITNLKILSGAVLALPRRGAINFHDGPLPEYAGLNVPAWALLNGETEHGVTWHEMTAGADTGPVLVARRFPVAPDETAFTLNARCYQEGLEAFDELLGLIEAGNLRPVPQELSRRNYFSRDRRPIAAGLLDWSQPADVLQRMVRALDFGPYPNPLVLPKIDLGGSLLLAREANVVQAEGRLKPGGIQAFDSQSLTVRCAEDAIRISRLTNLEGDGVDVGRLLVESGLRPGDVLPRINSESLAGLSERVGEISRHEDFWRKRIERAEPIALSFETETNVADGSLWQTFNPPAGFDASRTDALIASVAVLIARLEGREHFTLAWVPDGIVSSANPMDRFFASVVPLPIDLSLSENFEQLRSRLELAISETRISGTYLSDLSARVPSVRAAVACRQFPIRIIRIAELSEEEARRYGTGAELTILITEDGRRAGFLADGNHISGGALYRFLACLSALQSQLARNETGSVGSVELLSDGDRLLLAGFNEPPRITNAEGRNIHQLFERQAALTPERQAAVFEGRSMSYRELNEAANRLGRRLQKSGLKSGELAGVMVGRSLDMLVSLLAVLKTGAAYVPLDPVYPVARLAHMIEDAGLQIVITQREFAGSIPGGEKVVLEDVHDELRQDEAGNINVPVTASDLAYVIYTSGSTGRPKGVMVEHRNVNNFFDGMDAGLGTEPGVWLAVTSISFDISVLELFWTLARGFTVVIHADPLGQGGEAKRPAGRKIEFGFFYWNVAGEESEQDPEKYRLLLDGARYADSHGFNAVWNPERHFNAFGGLFPNPSVTCAALATITRNVSLRAGSCVVPLHSPIRIAEEWAVVDNLSNGRVGISIAAGWAPPDFAIRPENFAEAKKVMFESAEVVRRLWRGENVDFPGPSGTVSVRTLPRPIQKELPLWVTTAGNVDTFIQAGRAGHNLLTHLLGQSVEELAGKVRAYHQARSAAGHSGSGVVSLMLHTFIGPDAGDVERTVREPLKAYLKSAMFLVKAAAWQFPTFKKLSEEQGKTLDEFLAQVSDEDLDALLEFAFQRYFRSSGLFGTPDDCLAMVEKVAEAGVDEIACLIDFGIDTGVVLDHLPYLNMLRESANREGEIRNTIADPVDHSLPSLFVRHGVTHFQCTPSMAMMLVSDRDAASGLATLKHMLVGGEALTPDLARSLTTLVGGRVTNMYGPTETTVWSSCDDIHPETTSASNTVSIGRPLANQTIYVLDQQRQLLPPGVAGELFIGGAGVVRGYWQQPELTAERFPADPFRVEGSGHMYRTGDLGRHLPDGRIEYLGRLDQQVKIRGYRVELGEIESLLAGHKSLSEAAVLLREDVPGDQRLVAYVCAAERRDISDEGLKRWLRTELPEFMVPATYVHLDSLPRTPNGKIDRRSLPAPKAPQLLSLPKERRPRDEFEELVASIWQNALGVPEVERRANFFDIGGHSLLVVQVLNELRKSVMKPVKMTDLFKYTTVEALAGFISDAGDGVSAPDRARKRAEARRASFDRRRK
ncbi:MAG: MupA/Atu3671 family FMN-dependent luciferase-like monooxygenase [Acidobacteriota bacterium]